MARERLEQKENYSDSTTDTKIAFEKERSGWSERIKYLNSLFRKSDKLGLLQVELYGDIQRLIETKAKLFETMVGVNKILRTKKAESFIKIKTEFDVRVKTQQEQNIVMDNDLNEWLERHDLLNMQLSWAEETVKNLNNMLYGVKNYIQILTNGLE